MSSEFRVHCSVIIFRINPSFLFFECSREVHHFSLVFDVVISSDNETCLPARQGSQRFLLPDFFETRNDIIYSSKHRI